MTSEHRRRLLGDEEGFEDTETFDIVSFDDASELGLVGDEAEGPLDFGADEDLLDLLPAVEATGDELLGLEDLFFTMAFDDAGSADEDAAPAGAVLSDLGDAPMTEEELGLEVSLEPLAVLTIATEELGIADDTDFPLDELALAPMAAKSSDDLFEDPYEDSVGGLCIEDDTEAPEPPPPPCWAPLGLEEHPAGR